MNTSTAVQLLRNSLDRFLAKDMKGWTELCDENVVAEFRLLRKVLQRRSKAVRRSMNIYVTIRVSLMFVRFQH